MAFLTRCAWLVNLHCTGTDSHRFDGIDDWIYSLLCMYSRINPIVFKSKIFCNTIYCPLIKHEQIFQNDPKIGFPLFVFVFHWILLHFTYVQHTMRVLDRLFKQNQPNYPIASNLFVNKLDYCFCSPSESPNGQRSMVNFLTKAFALDFVKEFDDTLPI